MINNVPQAVLVATAVTTIVLFGLAWLAPWTRRVRYLLAAVGMLTLWVAVVLGIVMSL